MKKKYSFFERLAQAYGAGPQPRTYVITLGRIESENDDPQIDYAFYLQKYFKDKFHIEELSPSNPGVIALCNWAKKYDQILVSPTEVITSSGSPGSYTIMGGQICLLHSVDGDSLRFYLEGSAFGELIIFDY